MPGLNHAAQLADLRASLGAVASVRPVNCLDACEHATVIVIQPTAEGRRAGGRLVWLGLVNDHDATADITAWFNAGGPGLADPPDILDLSPSPPAAVSASNWSHNRHPDPSAEQRRPRSGGTTHMHAPRTPATFPTAIRLAGHGLILREWTDEHIPVMADLFDDPDVTRFTPLRAPFDRTAARTYLDTARENRAADRRIQLAITTDGHQPSARSCCSAPPTAGKKRSWPTPSSPATADSTSPPVPSAASPPTPTTRSA